MNTLGGYKYLDKDSAETLKENIILGKKYRISILTDRLIRLEYSNSGVFLDKPTQRVIFRKFPKNNYTVTKSETLIQIIGKYFTIDYVMEKSFVGSKVTPGNTLKITLNGSDRVWYYGHPEARNYGTINYSLDDFKGKLKLSNGLYSTDGFAFIDDSDSLILNDNGTFTSRTDKELDFYVFMYKKDLGLCLQDYYALTGYPMLIPRYALGNWWYKDTKYTNKDIIDTVTKFRENNIPISVFMLGNKWHNNEDFFNFDTSVIDPISLKQILNKFGIKLGASVDPSIPITNKSSSYSMISPVFGNANTVSFLPIDNNKLNMYSASVIASLISNGVDTTLVNYNNKKDLNGLALLDQYHYAMDSIKFNKRGLVLSRNHNLAIHRTSVIITGKTNVDWETLNILPRYNSSASNMGISYIVNPIGGYYHGIENFELYIRYIQFGVFSPMLVIASDDGKYYRREPWRWNISQEEIIKKYLKLRNKLIPYIYTEAYIYHNTGSPIVQPLYYKYPKIYDEPLYVNQYFFGSQMLVCPITKRKNIVMNRVVQRMFIPEGIWYELDSGKKYVGNKYYMSFYRDEDYPVFVKEGSIIVMSLDDDVNNPVNLEVDVFPGADGSYKLYEDDGITNDFSSGKYAITEYSFNYTKDKYDFIIKPTGNLGLVPGVRNYKIRFRNTNSATVSISDGVNNVPATATIEKNDLIISIPNVSSGKGITISISGTNLENSTMRVINDDIISILEDLEIDTLLKEKIDSVLFKDISIRKKRIEIRKLKRKGLEPKFIKMFLNLLEYIKTV